MASRLATVCMGLQHEYGDRYTRVSAEIEALPAGDPKLVELSEMRSLYAIIVVASIRHTPEVDRMKSAQAMAGVAARAVLHLAPDLVPPLPPMIPRLREPV